MADTSVKDRLMGATPAWQADPPPEVVIRHRSGSVSSRRPYPVAVNDRFIPNRPIPKGFSLIGVGEGNDVYLEPEEDAEPGSDEARDRIKRIKNTGAGAEVLIVQDVNAIPGEDTNRLRTLKVTDGTLLQYTQNLEDIELESTGATGIVTLPGGGQIEAVKGIVSTLLQGNGGWWGVVRWYFEGTGDSDLQMELVFEAGVLVNVIDGIVNFGDGTEANPGDVTFATQDTV